MLVELSVMEQRYKAVMAVLQDGWKVTEVAQRLGVARQSVHNWIARYEQAGLAGLADRSHRPTSCPHQTSAELEAMICEIRRKHPGWGSIRIEHELARQGVDEVPSESSIYRCLKRHNLIELRRRKKRRDEFRRWERDRPMQLWQMDVMSGVMLDDGTDLKMVTGIDDHSRFCVVAGLVPGAISRAVCGVFSAAMKTYGVPDEVLTDNGKVFTGRFGLHHTEVLFDRICREMGSLIDSPHRGHRLPRARSNASIRVCAKSSARPGPETQHVMDLGRGDQDSTDVRGSHFSPPRDVPKHLPQVQSEQLLEQSALPCTGQNSGSRLPNRD